jgi:tripartite-type tricarboxylate transporter receptor subunit TctC
MKLVALIALAVVSTANAQYPNKPVRVFVGYAAGSSTDIVGRVMADRLGAYWKQSVYVETRAGAAGNLAADAAAKAPGDGYTLLFAQNGLAISAAALPNLPYRAESDLLPLAPVAATPHILIVGPDFPAKSVQELVGRARADPGRLAFASSGVGNSDHLCGELFNLMAGIQAVHVPYKGGSPAALDVMAGRIAYYFAGMPVGLPLAKSGKVRALAVTGKRRFAGAPDIPTVAEALKIPDYEVDSWYAIFAPTKTPAAIVSRMQTEVARVIELPDVKQKLLEQGGDTVGSTPEHLGKVVKGELRRWSEVIRDANIRVE